MYARARRTAGLTLIEMALVVGTIALMVGFAVPAVRALINSFHSEGGVISMVDAALNSARTMAVSRQRYVGIRFQKLCVSTDPDDPLKGLMDAPQYMIFIVNDEVKNVGLANGFRAMEGMEPIKLPGPMGVMELNWITNRDDEIDEPAELSDATTFSIVFSPAGKLIVHDVRVRNQDGAFRPDNATGNTNVSTDDVFNSARNICLFQQGMFLQDDYSRRKNPTQPDNLNWGLGQEPSCTNFVIYDGLQFRPWYEQKTAWTNYLSRLATKAFYVSPYTGNLISSE